MGCIVGLFVFQVFTVAALVAVLVQGLVTAFYVKYQQYIADANVNLASAAVAIVKETPDASLDRILGTLIGVEDEKLDSDDPFASLFDLLRTNLPGSTPEFRRRVAEALPRLAVFSPDNAYGIAVELRDDYDSGRWGCDNRRRVIESLYLPLVGHKPFIHYLKKKQKENLLNPRGHDDIWTAFALYECIYSPTLGSRDMPKKLRTELVQGLDAYSKNQFSTEQQEAISLLVDIWSAAQKNDRVQLTDKIDSGLSSIERHKKAVAARAAVFLDVGNMETKLTYLEAIYGDEYKNVRRVAAREVSQRFLFECILKPNLEGRAQNILLALSKEDDVMIRTTMLDLIEFGYRGTQSFRDQLLDILSEKDTDGILTERITTARARKATL